ncbi:hypothetical protein O181_030652 [Austropuccinia psidii MF-1]|uniref:Tf2-1-like SH3-like domain-containing protein n=1 Tax=Austropuccinia psidii MF-1 TaxID=1389203 RepID=A0A9Q3CZ33_9BASI|nr:hypothetical protein [Austropuccinia psidii MF-1]
MEPDFKEAYQVLVSTLNFNNLKGLKKMRDSFSGPFTIIKLIGKNAVEVKLTQEFSRKHPVFPVSLVKPYFHTEEDKLPFRKKNRTPSEIVGVEDSPGPVKKIIKARKIRLNDKYQRQYLVRFKNQTADTDKWLAENYIPDCNLHLRRFGDFRRTEQSHQLLAIFGGRVCQPMTQNQSTKMTAKYHKPMVKPRYHQNMELSQTSSKSIKQKKEDHLFSNIQVP